MSGAMQLLCVGLGAWCVIKCVLFLFFVINRILNFFKWNFGYFGVVVKMVINHP